MREATCCWWKRSCWSWRWRTVVEDDDQWRQLYIPEPSKQNVFRPGDACLHSSQAVAPICLRAINARASRTDAAKHTRELTILKTSTDDNSSDDTVLSIATAGHQAEPNAILEGRREGTRATTRPGLHPLQNTGRTHRRRRRDRSRGRFYPRQVARGDDPRIQRLTPTSDLNVREHVRCTTHSQNPPSSAENTSSLDCGSLRGDEGDA